MPLIETLEQPTFARLRQEGLTVLSADRAQNQDIRELHIGLLNLMPDTALLPTERQFSRLIGSSNLIAQFHLHLFSLPSVPRTGDKQAHVDTYYESFEAIKDSGLDGLIISGANPVKTDLTEEPFWPGLCEVFEWASEHVTSTIYSCFATHAYLQYRYQEARQPLPKKCWGVFDHRVIEPEHPLVKSINHRFLVAHSRFNALERAQFERHGLHVLVDSEQAGPHLACSQDGFRSLFMQGHPEYDTHSLLKEFKREYQRYQQGLLSEFPPLIAHYFSPQAAAIIQECHERLQQGIDTPFPEELLAQRIENTWRDTSRSMINNWLGLIYQITGFERNNPFMPHVDPSNPLGLVRP